MTVQELIDRLQDMVDSGDVLPTNQVRFVYQANYPLQDKVKGVWFEGQPEDEQTPEFTGHERAAERTVYIVSAGQDHDQPYGPRTAFEEAW